MNAPMRLAMPHPVRRARLSAIDGALLDAWTRDEEQAGETDIPDVDAIGLWLFDLDDAAVPPANPVARHEQRGAAARRRLCALLGALLGRDEGDVDLLVGARGKPMLRAPRTPPLFFNASRSGSLGLVAVARGEIGIDVERCVHRRDGAGPGSGDEADPVERLRRWTRREAVAKATGIGLAMRLRSPLCSEEGSVQFGGTFWGWRDVGLPGDAQAVATIAYRERGQRRCG